MPGVLLLEFYSHRSHIHRSQNSFGFRDLQSLTTLHLVLERRNDLNVSTVLTISRRSNQRAKKTAYKAVTNLDALHI